MSDEKPSNEFDVNLSAEDSGDNSSTEIISEITPQGDCTEISSVLSETMSAPPLEVSPENTTPSEDIQPHPIPANDNSEILTLLRKLDKDFNTKLKYDTAKQELIDNLYKENIDFNESILDKFKRLLILAVIEQIDDAEKCIKSFEDKEYSEDNYRKLLNIFRDIAGEWQEMLMRRFGVSSYQSELNSPVNVTRQRILKQIPTDDATLYKHVHQTLRPGYEFEGQVLRPELVEVFVKQQ